MRYVPPELKSVDNYLKSATFHSQFRFVDIEIGKAMLSYERGIESGAYSEKQVDSLRERILTKGIALLEQGYLNRLQSAIDRGHHNLALLLFDMAFDARDRTSELDNSFMILEDGSRERIATVYQGILSKMFSKVNEEENRGKIEGVTFYSLHYMYARFCEGSPAIYDETKTPATPTIQQPLEAIV